MAALFGPAGNCEDFYAAGNRSSLEVPQWLALKGLDCYEYQCGRGVKISLDAAAQLGKEAKEQGILLSVHAPYYISLSSIEKEKRDKSVDYILQTLRAADAMGADRIVVHSGSCGKITRREALDLAKGTLYKALQAANEQGLGHIHLCPETMGKVNQLGNVEEVMQLCALDKSILPTIDFGHVNAQTQGSLQTREGFAGVLDTMDRRLDSWRMKNFHAHFSKIEYTNAGEKRHRTFAETEYEPDFEPLAELLAVRELTPRMICESAGTQTKDAAFMKEIYQQARERYSAAENMRS